MTTRIPWNDGNGNIVLTFTGQGNGTVTVESNTDNRGIERQQVLTFRTTGNNPVTVQVLVVQLSGQQYLTAQGIQLRTVDGKLLKVAPPLMIPLTAQGARLTTSEGKMLRIQS